MKISSIDIKQSGDVALRGTGVDGFLRRQGRALFSRGSAIINWHKPVAGAVLGLLLCIPSVAEAKEYVFSLVDAPGATRTAATGNSPNAVAGDFDDASGATHGFILKKGTFTTINVPGAESTGLNGINAAGSYTGTYFDGTLGRAFAFVCRSGIITRLDPAGSIHSQGGFINAQGDVVGGYRNASGRRLAFLWRNGVFTTIDPSPDATLGPVAFGINDRGEVVGTYVDTDGNRHGFLWSGGSYTALDVPGAVFTVAQGINNRGKIVGLYLGADGTFHGFVLSNGVYTTVDVPGSTSTSIYSINAKGEIVGEFDDADGTHGFVGTPARG